MRQLLIFCLTSSLIHCAPSPQYSGDTADLTQENIDTISEIFGAGEGGYTGQDTAEEASSDQLVKEFPNDYVNEENENLETHVNVEVDATFENCADYTEGFGYECVPYYQCSNGTIITDGAGLIDIRNGFGALTPEDSKCPGFLDVCCKDPDFVPPPPPPIVRYQPKCGRRNLNGLGARIQGFTDDESQFGEWPHMCAVLHEKPVEQEAGYSGEPETVNLYQCGGSLIAPGVLLTAAHCVDKFRQNPTELKIRCGEWDTQHQTEPYPHQDRKVSNLAIHPEFDGRNLQNDFAVLFVSEDFILDQHLDTACLPGPNEVFDGTTCFATGWGKDQFGAAGQYQVVLKEIDLPVVEHGVCQDKLRSTRLGQKFKLHDSFLCAGGINGKDTCKGDGGSPLVCPSAVDPDTYIQAGIVAWGIGCGEDGVPGVYADVSKASCWIDSAVTCHYAATSGSLESFFGNNHQCHIWRTNKLAELTAKKEGAGNFGKIFQAMIDEYNKCQVNWPQPLPSEPLVVDLERDTDSDTEGYGVSNNDNYSAPDMSVDIGAEENERLVDDTDAGSDYTPDKKVPIESQVVDEYAEPAKEKLVEEKPGYSEPTEKLEEAAPAPEYTEPKDATHVDPTYVAPQPQEAPVTCGAPVKLAEAAYTGDSADLTDSETKDDITNIANPY